MTFVQSRSSGQDFDGRRLSLLFHLCLCGYFQTFSELIEAASKGDQRGLDQFNDELLTNREYAEGDESLYSMFVEDVKMAPGLLFCFGKAVDSEMGITYYTH